VKKEFKQIGPERIPTKDALGRIAAVDILSEEDLPPYDISEKDGYAVNHSSILGASTSSPVALKVTQVLTPGSVPLPLQLGTCAKIFTGARLPDGADCVVMQEDVIERNDTITFSSPVQPGSNIFKKGSDIKKGEKIISKWNIFGPYELNVISSLNIKQVDVLPKLKIAVLSTGSELISQPDENTKGKILDTNKPVLINVLNDFGFQTIDAGIEPDDATRIANKIKEFIDISDAIVVTGGSSVGAHDLTISSIMEKGGRILFHGVKLRPSSTAAIASLSGKPVFSLSGLIQSSLVAIHLITIPTLRYIQGADFKYPKVLEAKLDQEIHVDLPEDFLRAVWVRVTNKAGLLFANPTLASSHSRSVFLKSNGIVLVRGGETLQKGDLVRVNIVKNLF
jgi:molybdenum cofactor synthesis domain-containing protein